MGSGLIFGGNLKLSSEPVRLAADNAMTSTCKNTGPVLSVSCMPLKTHVQRRSIRYKGMLMVKVMIWRGTISVADLE